MQIDPMLLTITNKVYWRQYRDYVQLLHATPNCESQLFMHASLCNIGRNSFQQAPHYSFFKDYKPHANKKTLQSLSKKTAFKTFFTFYRRAVFFFMEYCLMTQMCQNWKHKSADIWCAEEQP